MLVIKTINLETTEESTVHMHTMPKMNEFITLHDEEDAVKYIVRHVSHYAYTPNESHQYAAVIHIVNEELLEYYS